MPFKVGDRVRLKSGGPLMTVMMVEKTQYKCDWFDEAGHALRGWFDEPLLMSQQDMTQ
jgi:uncharacterized protein YodC (DUF2158 family)